MPDLKPWEPSRNYQPTSLPCVPVGPFSPAPKSHSWEFKNAELVEIRKIDGLACTWCKHHNPKSRQLLQVEQSSAKLHSRNKDASLGRLHHALNAFLRHCPESTHVPNSL